LRRVVCLWLVAANTEDAELKDALVLVLIPVLLDALVLSADPDATIKYLLK
jgi:hypothetical protein